LPELLCPLFRQESRLIFRAAQGLALEFLSLVNLWTL
jgi:hypothetical protein